MCNLNAIVCEITIACILLLHKVEYLPCKNLKPVQVGMVLFNLKAKAQKGN